MESEAARTFHTWRGRSRCRKTCAWPCMRTPYASRFSRDNLRSALAPLAGLLRTTTHLARPERPDQSSALPMPRDYGRRLSALRAGLPPRPDPAKVRPEQAAPPRQFASGYRTAQDRGLMAQRSVFRQQVGPSSAGRSQRNKEQHSPGVGLSDRWT